MDLPFDSATRTGSITGEVPYQDLSDLRKALEAGYGTDVSALTGGAALRVQSLDHTLQATLADNQHFRLFNSLPKPDATATVDEWTEANDQGGFPGGSTNTEIGEIAQAQGNYARRVGMVKYLMTRCEVSFVATLQGAIVSAEAVENQMGTLRLLRDVEHLGFYGDSGVVPTEFDGIATQIESLGSADHIVDLEGNPLASTGAAGLQSIANAAATIGGIGNFGVPTDLFASPHTAADLDVNLDPAYRVPLNAGQESKLGTPVRGIVTAQGDIAIQRDVFIQEDKQLAPFELQYPKVAAANLFAPAAVAGTVAGAVDSKFGAGHAGNYYYAVAGVNTNGQSMAVVSAQMAVGAGDAVTLTIDASATGEETGYAIYRGRLNGTNALADMRLMTRVARTGAQTVYVDRNRDIPGTSKAFLLNLSPGHTAITWRKLLPLTRFSLYATTKPVLPWALLMFGYLRISKRNQHVVFKNILPNGAAWRPFN